MAPPGAGVRRAPTINIDTTAIADGEMTESPQDIQPDSGNGNLSPHTYLAVPSSSESNARTVLGSPSSTSSMAGDDAFEPNPLKPEDPNDPAFNIPDNKFAFSPGQLGKLLNPKSLSAFRELGGIVGLERGLRTSLSAGLSPDEQSVEPISFDDAVGTTPDENNGAKPKELEQAPTTTTEPIPASGSVSKTTTRTNPRSLLRSTSKTGNTNSFKDRLSTFSDNRLPERKSKTFFELMWIAYKDKVLILLSIAAVVSLAVGIYQSVGSAEPVEWVEGVAILVAIAIVVIVGAANDYQKERQFVKLNKKKEDRYVKVVRAGKIQEISVFNVLVGDVMQLEQGDMVPVDGVFIKGHHVTCDESSATGESDLLKKTPAADVFAAIESHKQLRKMDPFILSGSKVTEGVGSFLVTATGIHSTYGKTMMSLQDEDEATPLQRKLNILAEYIAKLGGASALLYFVVSFIEFLVWLSPGKRYSNFTPAQKGQAFLQIFVTAVSVIVVAVPEGLPLAVTLALAFATTRMLRDNNLVRLLRSCETMGGATTVCSDKTGTLTQNVMTVVTGFVGSPSSRFSLQNSNNKKMPSAVMPKELIDSLDRSVYDMLEQGMALNSTAFEDDEGNFVGSKTETALLGFAREYLGMDKVAIERANAEIVQLIPFDSGRKCMGVVIKTGSDKPTYRLLVKGAPEIVLAKCRRSIDPKSGNAAEADFALNKKSNEIWKLITAYASGSLRTLAFASREFTSWPPPAVHMISGEANQVEYDDLLQDLTFVGVVGIQDPLRPGVDEAVKACRRAGVFVRMVTGDNLDTAKAIATECGILTEGGLALEGPEMRRMSSREMDEVIPKLQVLARSSPEDKRKLVERLKKMGQTVAVTGDGTNDAPALKKADVGFSMGIAGTEVAKEASAIILMDDNFASIVKALMWGRAVNDAVKKFLQFQVTVNIAAVIITFVSGVSGKTSVEGADSSVLSPVQLLWINLIMDTMAALALATDPPADSILDRKPDGKRAGLISVTMWKMIIGQAIYQMAVIFVLYFAGDSILSYQTEEEHQSLQTLVFNVFVWMQIFNAFNSRRLDNRFNIFEGVHRNWLFILMITIMCGAQVLIVFIGGAALQIEHKLNAAQWAYSLILGALSWPIGMCIRLVPDEFCVAIVPEVVRRLAQSSQAADEEDDDEATRFEWNPALTEVRAELAFLKKYKGGRLNGLKYKVKHPRDMLPARPSSTRQSSARSRSSTQTTLPAAVVAGGIVAGSIAGWSPIERPMQYAGSEHGREGGLRVPSFDNKR